MIEIQQEKKERALLVGVRLKDISNELVEEHLNELEELASTAGAETVIKVIQDRGSYDAAYFIGKGKAEEIAVLVEESNIDLIIFDDDLNPVQVRNLEKLINKKILDRSGLILDIFASRAKTKEAKTQVELAQLQYLLPRLTRAWTHLSKQYGGIGTKGPGETQIETDRRIIRTRIAHLKNKLEKIESVRETQTSLRKDVFRVSIVGYTNAGKSTLFNLLTKSDVFAEDKLFATLDPTTRVFEIDKNIKVLLSDTVGFIRKLPHHLVASFKGTLREVEEADLILHLSDFSHRYLDEHLEVVTKTLEELNCKNKPVIYVFNKVDLVKDKDKINYYSGRFKNSVIISARRGININKLIAMIRNIATENYVEEKIKLPVEKSFLVSKIYEYGNVLSSVYDEEKVVITIRTSKSNSPKIKKILHG